MQRKVTSYRLPDITLRQIEELVTITGASQANVISTAIDRMYQQEKRTDENADHEHVRRNE